MFFLVYKFRLSGKPSSLLFDLNKNYLVFVYLKKRVFDPIVASGYSWWVLCPKLKSLIKILIQKRIKSIKENGKKQ